MDEGFAALTEREKETLRLLLAGHEVKSIANQLGLSVHTINERLRDARRKLGVSSSREAARRLAEAEQSDPMNHADRNFGVATGGTGGSGAQPPQSRQGRGFRAAWLAGGMLIMSLIIAAVALSSAFLGHGVEQVPSRPIAATASEPAAASGEAARQWVALIDAGRWAESWQASGGLAKAQVGEAQFAAQLQPVREPLGAVARRTLEKVTKAVTLPGAPTGDYEILQFQTDFASRPGVTETVVMMREPGGWKSVGYFLR